MQIVVVPESRGALCGDCVRRALNRQVKCELSGMRILHAVLGRACAELVRLSSAGMRRNANSAVLG